MFSLAAIFALVLAIAACAGPSTPAPTPQSTPSPSPSTSPSQTPSATPSATSTPLAGKRGIWEHFPAPQLTPATPIPPPLSGLSIPDEVRVLVIAGVDRPLPYSGRTDALALVIYHPRLARASLVSLPPDLFGYIPGYTMQRLYTAYSVGGQRMLADTIEYNLGVRPDEYAVFNLNSFSQLIDDLGGINITVLDNIVKYCPNIPSGKTSLNGEEALCYMRLRLGDDEHARNLRQQDVLLTVFLRLVEGGNMVRVPELYTKYREAIDSNLTLDGILDAVPLALKLGDPNRVAFFQLGEEQLTLWEISSQPEAQVFLPVRPAVMSLMQKAVDFVTTPSPLSEVVVTLEYQLTVSPTPTGTFTQTPTPTASRTPRPTITLTPAPTTERTSTNTVTPTVTFTPISTWTPIPTNTTAPP